MVHEYKARPHNEIIETWFANAIKENEPFKAARYPNAHDKLKFSYQIAFVAVLLLWQLVKAVQGMAHEQAWKIGYDMMRDTK